MKRILVPLLTIFLVAAVTFAGEEPIATINFKNAGVNQVLTFYKALSGLELLLDSRIKTVYSTINLQPSEPLGRTESLKRIEMALLEQAGVVITRLDDKRASVTYNDALPEGNQLVRTSVGTAPTYHGEPTKAAPQGSFPGTPPPDMTPGLRVEGPPTYFGQPTDAAPQGWFLCKLGTYPVRDSSTNRLTITAAKGSDGKLSANLKWNSGSSATKPLQAGWFIYSERTLHRIWVYDGESLSVLNHTEKSLTDESSPDAFKNCPKEVRDALPEGARKRYFQ